MHTRIKEFMSKNLHNIHSAITDEKNKEGILRKFNITDYCLDKFLSQFLYDNRDLKYTDLKNLSINEAREIFQEKYDLPLSTLLYYISYDERDYLNCPFKPCSLNEKDSYYYPAPNLTTLKVKLLNSYLAEFGCIVQFNLNAEHQKMLLVINSLDYDLLQGFLSITDESNSVLLKSINKGDKFSLGYYSSLKFFSPATKWVEENKSSSCAPKP